MRLEAIRELEEEFGKKTVESLSAFIEESISEQVVKRDGEKEVISSLERLEQSQEALEKEYILFRNEFNSFRSEEFNGFRMEVNSRFDTVNQRFDTLRQDIDQKFDQMNDRILKNMYWSVGTIALFGAILTALVTVFKIIG